MNVTTQLDGLIDSFQAAFNTTIPEIGISPEDAHQLDIQFGQHEFYRDIPLIVIPQNR